MLQCFLKKARDERSWSIDSAAGHCAFGNDIHVCFDPSPTHSGAIRAVGPFGPSSESIHNMSSLMIDVTMAIEKCTGGYVVWGEIQDDPDYLELSVSILGGRCGFIPNISLRSALLLTKPCDIETLSREWDLSLGYARHRSNALSEQVLEGPVDLALLHPLHFVAHLNMLEQVCGSLVSSGPFNTNARLSGWTSLAVG